MFIPKRIASLRRSPSVSVLLLLILSVGNSVPAGADAYVAEYLAPFAEPVAINENGDVVGWNPMYMHPFIYTDELGYLELRCFQGMRCRAVDIGDSGLVAGVAEALGIRVQKRAMVWNFDGLSYVPSLLPVARSATRSETVAVAVNGLGQVLGISLPSGSLRESYFVWSKEDGLTWRRLPGQPVDLNDRGQIAGNAGLPFVYDLATGSTTWSALPLCWVGSAKAHAISPGGELAGALLDPTGWKVAARTEKLRWTQLAGGGAEDHLFGMNSAGDGAGHVHGLDPASHCGVFFVEEGEVASIESYSYKATRLWRLGEAVAGLTDRRWLAAAAVHDLTGLPGLVRLKPEPEPVVCDKECLAVVDLAVYPARFDPEASSYLYIASITIGTVEEGGPLPKATSVEVTWVLEGGAVVRRESHEVGLEGSLQIQVASTTSGGAEIYVTALGAAGYRFDATSGVLHATTPATTGR